MRFLIMRDAHEKYTATLLKLLTFCYTFSLDHQISKNNNLKSCTTENSHLGNPLKPLLHNPALHQLLD